MRLQGWEWIIILAIVLLLWGAPKLPALAKSAAQSMRIFKKEEKGAGKNHVHYVEQTVKVTMTKSEFYQYMTSSKEQIEVIAEEKRYNSKDCVMVSSM